MNSVLVSVQVDAPAARVWETIGDPGAIAVWHPAITESPRDGAVRTCVLADGAVLRERIESVDNDARAYTYSIVESPLPVVGYRSTIAVRELSGQRAAIDWSSTFDTVAGGDMDAAMVAMVRGVYEAGLDAVRQRLV